MDSDRPLIRHLTCERRAAWPLSADQERAIARFLGRDYRQTPNPCFCGGDDDVLVARRDCYGLPLHARLCRRCGLMRIDPYLDDDSTARFYRDDYRGIHTSRWSDPSDYFELQQFRGRRILKWLATRGIAPPARVFEIGCGAGGILDAFRAAGADVTGCDYGPDLLEVGRARGLALETGASSTLAGRGRADLVVMSHVLEHVRHAVDELRAVRTLLAPGGALYVEVPGLLAIRGREKTLDRYLQYAHVWHFSLRTLDLVMAHAGFRRVHGDEAVRTAYVPDDAVAPRPDPTVFHDTVRSLRSINRRRFVPRVAALPKSVIPVARAVLGKDLYRRARRLYGRAGGEIA